MGSASRRGSANCQAYCPFKSVRRHAGGLLILGSAGAAIDQIDRAHQHAERERGDVDLVLPCRRGGRRQAVTAAWTRRDRSCPVAAWAESGFPVSLRPAESVRPTVAGCQGRSGPDRSGRRAARRQGFGLAAGALLVPDVCCLAVMPVVDMHGNRDFRIVRIVRRDE